MDPPPLVLTSAVSPPRLRELLCNTCGGPDCSRIVEPAVEEDDSGGDICIDGAPDLAAPAKRIVKLRSAISWILAEPTQIFLFATWHGECCDLI